MTARLFRAALAAAMVVPLAWGLAAPTAAKPDHGRAAQADPIGAALADPGRSDDNRKLDIDRKPADILAFARVKPGQSVADWGPGSGYYSELLADLVGPRGRVYAVGLATGYKKEVWEPLVAHHPNILPLFVPGDAQALAPDSLDLIFAHLEYHDLYWVSDKYHYPRRDVDAVLRNWFASLHPGGTVVVIDHAAAGGDPRDTADKYHRIDPARVRDDFARAGFVPDGESAVLRRDDDPHNVPVFDPSVRGHTDRFVFRFRRPA